MKVKLLFAWYDLWIGVFIRWSEGRIYIFLIPMIGIVITYLPDNYFIEKLKSSSGVKNVWLLRRKVDESQVGAFYSYSEAVKFAKSHERFIARTPTLTKFK